MKIGKMAVRDSRYVAYATWPYNHLCMLCAKRWMEGESKKFVEPSICKPCQKEYAKNPLTRRQRLEAECNEAAEIVFKRITQCRLLISQ